MIKLSIPDMSCGHCKAAVEKAVAGVAPGATVAVDLPARTAEVGGVSTPEVVIAALKSAGYEAQVI